MTVRYRDEACALLDVVTWNREQLPPQCSDATEDQYLIDHQFKSSQPERQDSVSCKGSRKRSRPQWGNEEVKSVLSNALSCLMKNTESQKYFKEESSLGDGQTKNEAAYIISKKLESLDDFRLPETCYDFGVLRRDSAQNLNGFHSCIRNDEEKWKMFICQGERFIIPPLCSFLMADLRVSRPLMLSAYEDKQFDLLVMDPPWANKSVKRQKRYHCMENCDLLRLPIHALLASAGLVAIWCTNCEKHQRYLEDTLLPAWGLRQLGKWFWLKVTRSGQPVLPLDFPQRRPFEMLYIAAPPAFRNSVPEKLTVVSVPSSLHSRKPPLFDLLRPFLHLPETRKTPNCLELFARELRRGWDSWGNEPLRLQHTSCFRMDSEKDCEILSASS